MLTFQRITGIGDDFFTELYALYVAAFPAPERRSWTGFDRELSFEQRFYANAILQNGEFAGFFNYWDFGRFVYVEHFAVVPKLRSQKIGTRAMQTFMEQVSVPVILEVEMPNDATTIRRIRFYEGIGFRVVSHYYAQPPYEGPGFMIPMLLMSSDVQYANTHYEIIKNTLYKNVYHFVNPSEEVEMKPNLD